jgi:multiple sugar transport system permease protein
VEQAETVSAPARRPLEDFPQIWLAPLFVLLGALYLYPVIDVIRLSFTDAGDAGAPVHYTVASYRAVFGSPEFIGMARVTAIFVAASIAGQVVFGMLIAVLVCAGEQRRLPGAALVRAIVLVGWVLPGVVIGIIWKLLLDESGSGIFAYAASALGFHDAAFLSAPAPALAWVTVANIWRGTAFSMIMQYAGMKTVPAELYEAATVDGAGALQQFRNVTLPSLRGILLINLVLITIATLNTFDMVLPLTGGGPGRATEVVALYVYHLVFSEFQLGRGAAVAVFLMAFGLALSACYARMIQREAASA